MAVAGTAALVVAACGGGGSTSSPAGGTAAPPGSAPASAPGSAPGVAEKCTGQELTFQLSFIPNVQHAGFLLAAEQGFYEDEGLQVEIVPAGPNVDQAAAIGDGTVSLGQVDYGQILRARAAGVPIVSIAQTYKDTFIRFYTTKDSGIDTIEEWAGKTIGQQQVGDDPESTAMLASVGLGLDDVEVVQQDFGVEDFLAEKVDVGTGVVFFHPAAFNGQTDLAWPDDFNIFVPEEHGATIATQTVATTEEMIQSDPAALRCFLRASIRGWQATFEDSEAAVDATMTFVPEGAIPREHQSAAIADVLPIVGTDQDDDLLRIDPAQYETSMQVLLDVGFIEEEVDVAASYDTSIYDTMGPLE
jgi:NitT/TauT family transport system substrate-binding protein